MGDTQDQMSLLDSVNAGIELAIPVAAESVRTSADIGSRT
jgi:hypothetical protein